MQVTSQISNITVIFRPERFNLLKDALKGMGILGMTVIHVEGCGLQGGKVEYYRGSELKIDLLPKTKVEIIAPTEKVEAIIESIQKVLKTGEVGDGKIFVYDVQSVVRIRNGSRGLEALSCKEDE
ncbi:P-II family nitrogen regulator [Treponema sp.]|uniref:P-II family nitrogen regulator n=1 Tax=Treponema sp. TaxID=166 RepID=UPI0025E5A2BD|nr:P-II family nitrogen regulator [Treponema sp.]MCR5217559.1 P-II family nitrogen regulator [Treponema sp.]